MDCLLHRDGGGEAGDLPEDPELVGSRSDSTEPHRSVLVGEHAPAFPSSDEGYEGLARRGLALIPFSIAVAVEEEAGFDGADGDQGDLESTAAGQGGAREQGEPPGDGGVVDGRRASRGLAQGEGAILIGAGLEPSQKETDAGQWALAGVPDPVRVAILEREPLQVTGISQR